MFLTTPKRASATILLLGGSLLLAMTNAYSEELLHASVTLQDEQSAVFSLSGDSLEEIIGGQITLGDRVFLITKQSRLGLIGARRELIGEDAAAGAAEYAVFSSSFSSQTGVGQPWISATDYLHCEQPYNSFLALYQVTDNAALAKLGPVPYPVLAEGKGAPDKAIVYCFYAKPPA
ncbi:MAG: hypothetical protein R3F53_09125 [Gammaproteobacteria bacterium]